MRQDTQIHLERRSVRSTTIRSLNGLGRYWEVQETDAKDNSFQCSFVLKNKQNCDFSYSNQMGGSKKIQKAIDILEKFQADLIENQHEDISTQLIKWVTSQRKSKDKLNSISFNPHTLTISDTPLDEQKTPKIIESIKKLIQIIEEMNIPPEQLERQTIDLIQDQFMDIYKRIENAFDEEATVDNSVQNGYIFLKGKRAFKLLKEFSVVFSENEPIYKIFPMSKSESFSQLLKFNLYIKKYVLLTEEDGFHQGQEKGNQNENGFTHQQNPQKQQDAKDLTTEKINVYLTLLERLQCSLETLVKGFKSHAQALEEILKKIEKSEMIPPFYDARLDLMSAPDEATTSISMSKGNSMVFQDANGKKKQGSVVQQVSDDQGVGQQTNMEMIQESDEEDDEDLAKMQVEQRIDDSEGFKKYNSKGKKETEKEEINEHKQTIENLEQFVFQIEYLKPGNIPWDLQTIRSVGKIGSGGQGTVFKAFDPTKERQIALKFTNIPYNWENQKDSYLQEIRIQSFMTHKKMKRILEVDNKVYIYQDKYGQQQMYLVSLMELGVGSLEDFFKLCVSENRQITDEEIFSIFFDILDGLEGMHKLGYAHKDIKPQNVIYSIKDKSWKIADFGCIQRLDGKEQSGDDLDNFIENHSKNIENHHHHKQQIPFLQECLVTGTPSYMSPELYKLYQQRHEKGYVNMVANDFYSLGITLLKLREMEKIDRSKLSEKIMINKLATDRLSKLITLLLNDDQLFRSQLNQSQICQLFLEEYQDYITKTPEDYLESVFKYNENAQDNLTMAQKLECAKTYQNVNLREKCLRYFDEVVNDAEFQKIDIFEKHNILAEQSQALSFFGDYDRAHEQQIKCLQISLEELSGFQGNEIIVSDLKFLGQILFNQGNYDQALQKYLQVLQIVYEAQDVKNLTQNSILKMQGRNSSSSSFSDSATLKQNKQGVQFEKSIFHKEAQLEIENKAENSLNENEASEKAAENTTNQNLINTEQDDQVNTPNHSDNNTNTKDSNEIQGQNECENIKLYDNLSKDTIKDLISNIGPSSSDLHIDNSVKQKDAQNYPEISIQDHIQDGTKKYIVGEEKNKYDEQSLNQNSAGMLSSNSKDSKNPASGNIIDQVKDHSGEYSAASSVQYSASSHQPVLPKYDSLLASDNSSKLNLSFHQIIGDSKSSNEVILQAIQYDNSLANNSLDGFSQDTQNELASIQMLIGQALNKLGHYDKALQYYEQALRTMEHNLGKNDSSVAFILDSMGESLLNNGKYKESFRIFKRSYKIKRAEYGKSSVHLAETINSMGKVLEKLTLYEKSAQHYEKALHIFEQHYGHNHIKTAEILNNLGCVKRAEGDYKEAYNMFKEVLSITSNHYPSDHIELGKIYHDIGNVLRNQENLELSLEYFLKANDIKTKYYGPNHVEVSNTCQYIGIIYRKMEKIEKAQQYFELALGPMENHYGKDHIEVVKLVQEIAVLLQIQGLDLLAKEKLEFVLQNRLKEFGYFHIKTANTMQNVATVEMELGNYGKSLQYNLQVLEVRKKTFGDDHLKVANSHTSIAQLHDLMGNYAQAADSLDQAMKIYSLDVATNKSKIQAANIIRAKILINNFRLQQAQTLLEDDLTPSLKQGSLNFAQTQILLSLVFQLQSFLLMQGIRKWFEPEEILKEEQTQGTAYSDESREKISGFIARVSKSSPEEIEARIQIAKENIESALQHYEKNFGKEHYLYAQILEQQALIYRDSELAKTALCIKQKRFDDQHIEILNTQEIICCIESYTIDKNNVEASNILLEKLKALESLKISFYENNSTHITLVKTRLLQFYVTNDQQYKTSIFKILTSQPRIDNL